MKANCKDIGGPADCGFVAEGSHPEEVIGKATEHAKVAHPAVYQQMKGMNPTELADWTAKATAKMHT